ncbi:MAG: hypothetical protein PHI27_07405 [Eubacteriales bacterium]|nr:hypothetical protein [Eubacteriales bacterium]MDD3882061.1 hypothetical protein [Eubacteriales bacterium]MDD4512508.1 hypothetical protein [Eubacteriales bacterium]
MSYRITKVYREPFPHCRFVGIKYKNSDRVNGGFGDKWGYWHSNGMFDKLESQLTEEFKASYPDFDAYIGLEKNKRGAPNDYYEYWIGMFLPEGAEVPTGYDYVDLCYDYAAVCWITGTESDVFMREDECWKAITDAGIKTAEAEDGGMYFFERCQCPRFTTPDENGNITLDIGFFAK